jgi:hypothetical protein
MSFMEIDHGFYDVYHPVKLCIRLNPKRTCLYTECLYLKMHVVRGGLCLEAITKR